MSQITRKSKFKTKLETKTNSKFSLPIIDPLHAVYDKNLQKPAVKLLVQNKKKNHQPKSSSFDNNPNPKQFQLGLQIDKDTQNEHDLSGDKVPSKNNSIQIEKHLTTADTIRPQLQGNCNDKSNKNIFPQGLDMWNLNKNLKQFSQTRKLTFYKTRNLNSTHSTIQTPYFTLNKTKTQQIRSMYKVYETDMNKTANPERQKSEGQLKFKKAYDPVKRDRFHNKYQKSHSTIPNTKIISPLGNTLYGTLPVRRHVQNPNTTLYKPDSKAFSQSKIQSVNPSASHLNPYLKTFINGSHLKRQFSKRNIQIVEINSKDKTNNEFQERGNKNCQRKNASNNFRKNRFQKFQMQESSNSQDDIQFDDQYSKYLNHGNSFQNKSSTDRRQSTSNPKIDSSDLSLKKEDLAKRAQQKKMQYEYNRSIQRVNKIFLKSAQNYMDEYYRFSVVPTSKIQFYIDSLNHPQFTGHTAEYKSSYQGNGLGEVDFSFRDPQQNAQKQSKKKQSNISKPKRQSSKYK